MLGARDLARQNVRIFAFALRPKLGEELAVYQQVALTTGGTFYLTNKPADIIEFAPHVPLTGIASLKIENLSANKPARAVRLQPDGSFDGFAPLTISLTKRSV